MKKRDSQATPKNEKDATSSLLKVLRPKVYITDSSSFKRLVQELTGNGSKTKCPSQPAKQEIFEKVPVIQIEDDGERESSSELCIESPDEQLGVQALSPLAAFTALQTSWCSAQNDPLLHQELDSWLQEFDSSIFYDGYNFPTEQELCISDYDLSEIYRSIC